MAITTPLPRDSLAAAVTTALYKFNGPSALMAVEAHGSYQYNRLVTLHSQVQEKGGFFHRVSP